MNRDKRAFTGARRAKERCGLEGPASRTMGEQALDVRPTTPGLD